MSAQKRISKVRLQPRRTIFIELTPASLFTR